jgi:hypothetical protein
LLLLLLLPVVAEHLVEETELRARGQSPECEEEEEGLEHFEGGSRLWVTVLWCLERGEVQEVTVGGVDDVELLEL